MAKQALLLRGTACFNGVLHTFTPRDTPGTGLKTPLGGIPDLKTVKRREFIWESLSACFCY